jgi:tRNA(Ile)-lysidine synthase
VRAFDAVDGAVIVRPILSAPKSEIISSCNSFGIEYVTDSTNFETDCTRNAIRNIIVPELERLFGSPQKNAARLSRAAKEDSDRLNAEASDYLKEQDTIKLVNLASMHPSVAKRVVKFAFAKISNASLESVHVESILALAKHPSRASVSLPNNKKAVADKGILTFENDTPPTEAKPFSVALKPGFNTVPGGRFLIHIGNAAGSGSYTDENENIYKLYTSVSIKNVKIEELCAESRREGDFIRQGGMSKKVKKLLCDNGIKLADRDHLPIIRRGKETLYVPMCAVADAVRADKKGAEYVISIYKIIN